MLTQALREQFTGVRAFAFVDTTDEVTRLLRARAPTSSTRSRGSAREADVVGFDGHSDYGNALRGVRRAVAGGGRAEDVAAGPRRRPHQLPRPRACRCCADLVRRSRLGALAQPGAAPAVGQRRLRGRPRTARSSPMVECRNAAQLADFVTTL